MSPRQPEWWAAIAAVAAIAAGLRFGDLAKRPMHADEAVLADKFGALLERGEYRYDPANYHGPALLYFTLPAARLGGFRSYAELNETVLRAVTALAGLALALMPLALARGLGRGAALAAALFSAISPALVFYSRYYIPEMLLALFSFAAILCGWRYMERPRAVWAVLFGAAAGLAYATKETAVIALAAMVVALVASGGAGGLHERLKDNTAEPLPRGRASIEWRSYWVHALFALAAGAVVALLLFGPAGLIDSFRGYAQYVSRAAHDPLHRHSPFYYLHLTAWFHEGSGPVWTEAAILVFGLAGAVLARRGLARFLAVYALTTAVCYSAIPYKTPWCLVQFWQPLAVLAGVGAARVLAVRRLRAPAAVFLVLACGHLAWQAGATTREYAADPRNPYVYAHTGRDVFLIRDRVAALRAAGAQRVQILSSRNLWPLPWYMRGWSGVEWWPKAPEAGAPGEVILLTPEMEPAAARLIYELRPPGERELYMDVFGRAVELRPGVFLRGYAAPSVWEKARLSDVH